MAQQGLSNIGIDVSVDGTSMNYVTDIGDIGAAPSDLDATCMKDTMKKYVPGVQDTKSFEVTFLYDSSASDSDYRVLKAKQDAGKIVPVVVSFPDGSSFSTTGYISVMVSGVKVDELISATMTVSLQSDWDVNYPTSNSIKPDNVTEDEGDDESTVATMSASKSKAKK